MHVCEHADWHAQLLHLPCPSVKLVVGQQLRRLPPITHEPHCVCPLAALQRQSGGQAGARRAAVLEEGHHCGCQGAYRCV